MLRNLLVNSGLLRAFFDPRRSSEREAYTRVLQTLCASLSPMLWSATVTRVRS